VDKEKVKRIKALCMKLFDTDNVFNLSLDKIKRELAMHRARHMKWQSFAEKYSGDDFKKILTSEKNGEEVDMDVVEQMKVLLMYLFSNDDINSEHCIHDMNAVVEVLEYGKSG